VPARLAPCDPQDVSQSWTFNATAPGYLSNAAAAAPVCLNVYGCKAAVAYYDCVTSGGTCAGPDDYSNLQWRLDAQGRLLSLLDAQCVTVAPDGSVSMVACAAQAQNQTWAYDAPPAGTGALRLAPTALCLATPPPPPPPIAYVQLCGRIEAYDSFSAPSPPGGYCLALNSLGAWALTAGAAAGAKLLASGNVTMQTGGSFDPLTSPTRLQVAMAGTAISAAINGTTVATVTDASAAFGLVSLGSGYHAAAFRDFAVAPVPPAQ